MRIIHLRAPKIYKTQKNYCLFRVHTEKIVKVMIVATIHNRKRQSHIWMGYHIAHTIYDTAFHTYEPMMSFQQRLKWIKNCIYSTTYCTIENWTKQQQKNEIITHYEWSAEILRLCRSRKVYFMQRARNMDGLSKSLFRVAMKKCGIGWNL